MAPDAIKMSLSSLSARLGGFFLFSTTNQISPVFYKSAPLYFVMKNFRHTGKVKEFYGENPYTHHLYVFYHEYFTILSVLHICPSMYVMCL